MQSDLQAIFLRIAAARCVAEQILAIIVFGPTHRRRQPDWIQIAQPDTGENYVILRPSTKPPSMA